MMISIPSGTVARLALALAAAGAFTSLQAAPPVHVMVHGDTLDPTVAYVILVPHLKTFGKPAASFRGVIAGKTTEGDAREYGVDLASDQPVLVRVAPGRYSFARLQLDPYTLSIDPDKSQFDAKAGQLNYPGDWDVDVKVHDMMRGAAKIGWDLQAAMWSHEQPVDVGRLDLDPAFTAALKPVYTRVEASGGRGDL